MRRIVFPKWLYLLLILATGGGLALTSGPAAAASAPWTYQTIATYGDVGQYASLISAPSNRAMSITYYSATWGRLMNAWSATYQSDCNANSGWDCFAADIANSNNGKYSSQAYNAAGDYEGIAYQDVSAYALKFASNQCVPGCNHQAWTIDDTPGVITAQGTSLKFDPTGKPHIAYYQAFPAALRYSHYVGGGTGNCSNPDWQCETIESGTALGHYPSLDLDAIGQPHIAYYDGGTGKLKYAYHVNSGGAGCSGGTVSTTWTCQVVDASGGAVGSFAVLHQSKCLFNPCNDSTQIAYYDEANHALKYARSGGNGQCSAGAAIGWQCDIVETVGQWLSPALYLSMAVDDNVPQIAYYDHDDAANGRLKLATPMVGGNCGPNGGLFFTWQCDTVDSGNTFGGSHDVGMYPSMVASSAGRVSIAYYDATATDLEWATQLAQQIITFNPLLNKTVGDAPFTVSANASSGLPVAFKAKGECSVNGASVTLSGVAGQCTITARQYGDATYSAAPDVAQSFVISDPVKQNQTITFAPLSDKSTADVPFTLSANASSGLPVSFTASGKCTVNGSTVTLSGVVGKCTITAHQIGNTTYNAAPDVARSFMVKNPPKQGQTISFAALPDKTLGDPPFQVSATASSGLPVSFTASGKCSISGAIVSLSGQPGNCTIVASQAGDSIYSAASEVSRSFAINSPAKQNQTISFAALPNRMLGDAPFQVSATASSGLLISFGGSTPAICSVSGTTVTLLSVGICTIIASQDGSGSVNAAADVTQSFLINAGVPAAPETTVYLPINLR